MRFYIVIPAYNEEEFIERCLESLVKQTYLPTKICVVDDNSTDNTSSIIKEYAAKFAFIKYVKTHTSQVHLPGSKVIKTFCRGYEQLDSNYDIICKFDADLIFPENYLASLKKTYESDKKIGMAGGFCYIEKEGAWVLESLTASDHIRGALKSYRKACFEQIGGLKAAMGWDTVDEMQALFYKWKVQTIPELHVKHLKPTGNNYNPKAKYKQGEAFYKMRYRFTLTFLATAKLAVKKKSLAYFVNSLVGFFKAAVEQQEFLLSAEQGRFIRQHRWKGIKEKYLKG